MGVCTSAPVVESPEPKDGKANGAAPQEPLPKTLSAIGKPTVGKAAASPPIEPDQSSLPVKVIRDGQVDDQNRPCRVRYVLQGWTLTTEDTLSRNWEWLRPSQTVGICSSRSPRMCSMLSKHLPSCRYPRRDLDTSDGSRRTIDTA